MSSRPWIKLYAKWYETASHRLLSPRALHTGPHLLVLASRSEPEEDGTAWLISPTGKAYTMDELSVLTGWPARAVASILEELVRIGTMLRDNERYGFPNFGEYQGPSSTDRTREWRSRERGKKQPVTRCDVTPPSHGVTGRDKSVTDAEADAELTPKPPCKPRGPSWWREIHAWAEGELVARGYRRTPKGLTPKQERQIGRLAQHVRAALKCDQEAAQASIREHVEYRLRTAPHDPETRKRIGGNALWGTGWWDWWHASPDRSSEATGNVHTAPDGRRYTTDQWGQRTFLDPPGGAS